MRKAASVRVITEEAKTAFLAIVNRDWNGKKEAAQTELVDILHRAYANKKIQKKPPEHPTFIYRWFANQNAVPADAWMVIETFLEVEPGALVEQTPSLVEQVVARSALTHSPIGELANLELFALPRENNALKPYDVHQKVALEATVSFGMTLLEWESEDASKTYKGFVSLLSAELRLYLKKSRVDRGSGFAEEIGYAEKNGMEVNHMGGSARAEACRWTINSAHESERLRGKLHVAQLCNVTGRISPDDHLILRADPAALTVVKLMHGEDEGPRDPIAAGVQRRVLEILTRGEAFEVVGPIDPIHRRKLVERTR